jgi:hypothetical protein
MIASLLGMVATLGAPAADVAVVCPPEFRAELQPWLEHRTRQGHRIVLLKPMADPGEMRASIRRAARQGRFLYLLLVGDVPESPRQNGGVPTHYVPATINVRWGSEPVIASDHPYADLDDDDLPDLAVGRLPVDSPAELRLLVRKIMAYESNPDFGLWRRRVNFVAGLGGFGALADAALEAAARKLITDGLPACYQTTMTYSSWRSPYCPDPRRFRSVTLDRLNEGALFWVYIGHGHSRQVDHVRVPVGEFPILSVGDTAALHCDSGQPIACFLACYTGAFDLPADCLGEEMLRSPGGPIAVYAGSRVTMPYAMSVMGIGMLETCFGANPPRTLGEAVMKSKQLLMRKENLSANRRALDGLAALVSPAPADLEGERREHLYLFNLLGDPLLRLPTAGILQLDVRKQTDSAAPVRVVAECPIAGTATFELVVRRDRTTFRPPPRPTFEPTERFLTSFDATYESANDQRLASQTVAISAHRPVEVSFKIPADNDGPCYVRAFVRGKRGCALGACEVSATPVIANVQAESSDNTNRR